MFPTQSAVRSVNAVNVPGATKHFLRNIFSRQAAIKMDWKAEKEKYLSMNTEEKRKYLSGAGRDFKIVDSIPTWAGYYEKKSPLPQKIDILGGFQIKEEKNAELASKVCIFKGDITELEVDTIVNAANSSLAGGGGVDGAIHRAAGKELKAECLTLNGCAPGEAKITGGYKLPARYVIHTVGPQKEKPDILTMCYKNCLQLMLQNQLKTIAFPCIATGIYGYPIAKAVHVSNRVAREVLEQNSDKIDKIVFCLFGDEDVDIYERALQSYFPVK